MKRAILEICCGNYRSVENAVEAGAERIELCSALSVGGLTPSYGLMKRVRKNFPGLKVHVLIRPREGNFVYNQDETEEMLNDIQIFRHMGADGFVVGALTMLNEIDISTTTRLIQACGPDCSVTFHRAFDRIPHQLYALLTLIRLGCDRILTSGGESTALEGTEHLKMLTETAQGKIIIMPGAGVNPDNIAKIVSETLCTEIHGSFAEPCGNNGEKVAMGKGDTGQYLLTNPQKVKEALRNLDF